MLKKKTLMVGVLFLLMISMAVACQDSYGVQENVSIFDTIVNIGLGASCNITVYNETSQIQVSPMASSDLLYSYDAGVLPRGTYTSAIHCNQTTGNSTVNYYSSCDFEVKEDDSMSLAAIILLPILFAFILLKISSNLDEEEHWVFKLFLNFLTIPLFFVSGHFSVLVLVEYYGFDALQIALSRTTFYYGLMFAVMLFYIFIYSLWKFNMYKKIQKESRYD